MLMAGEELELRKSERFSSFYVLLFFFSRSLTKARIYSSVINGDPVMIRFIKIQALCIYAFWPAT